MGALRGKRVTPTTGGRPSAIVRPSFCAAGKNVFEGVHLSMSMGAGDTEKSPMDLKMDKTSTPNHGENQCFPMPLIKCWLLH